jgi:predicted metal-dependent HD superfamily phosphohydrolase
VLEGFAAAPAIFRTRLRAVYERPARDNLAAGIRALAAAA